MTKKILIAAVIFFLIALGVGWYLIFMKSPVAKTPADDQNTLPFGPGSGNADLTRKDTTLPGQYPAVEVNTLMHLSSEPVSGAAFVETSASTTLGRIAERATSHVYDINLSSGAVTRASVTTLPTIYESLWFNNGASLVLRGIDADFESITSYLAKIVPQATTSPEASGELQGIYLPSGIETMAVAPSGKNIFYMVPTQSEIRGILANTDNTKPSTIYTSPAVEWLVTWPHENTITLTTKASRGERGFLYFLDTKGNVEKILGNILGLTTLTDPTVTQVAYSNNANSLSIFNITSKQNISTSIRTLAEKCVWSNKEKNILYCAVPTTFPAGGYPDDWYQGSVSFSDSIYKVNALSGTSTIVSNLGGRYNQNIDVINPSLSKNDEYLVFMNKKDLTAWSLKIK